MPYVYILGNKVRINFLAFFSSKLMKVFGATIAEKKKIKLPIRKGIKKVTRILKISVIFNYVYLIVFKKKTMMVRNNNEFKIYFIYPSY